MSTPSVAILMATYNGEKFLRAQMDSFAAQTYANWSLHVSDDGSTDDTRAQIAAFSNDHPAHTITVVDGPRQGYAQNFLSLITSIKTDAAYFAYSDQDDIWEPEKMERAVAWLSTIPAHVPALYGARTLYVSHDDEPLYPSRLFTKPLCFSNALVQSFAGGNTMMMNRAARDLMPVSIPIVAHDWWAYLLVSGAGGALYYDPHPCMRYRQHAQNLLGQNISLRAKIARIRGLFSGTFKAWNDVNIAALATLRGKFTPQNQATLDTFAHTRQLGLARRIIGLYRSKIHRQTALGNLGLIVAALTNRI